MTEAKVYDTQISTSNGIGNIQLRLNSTGREIGIFVEERKVAFYIKREDGPKFIEQFNAFLEMIEKEGGE
jgi:hypothetical protein